MQKTFTVFVFLLLLIWQSAYNQNVDKFTAANVAINAINERAASSNTFEKGISYSVKSSFTEIFDGVEVFHVFNFYPEGFAIISSDKSGYPLLGFSFESYFSENERHPAIDFWLESYSIGIKENIENNVKPCSEILNEWYRLIADDTNFKMRNNIKTTTPMLKTKWNQGIYYNAHCPPDPEGPGGRTVAGCVAVALGQVMYYFRHPQTGVGEYSYHHDDYGTLSVNFAEQYYDYDQMPVRPTTHNDHLAKLLYHLGVSVDMDYGPSGSGMYNHKGAFTLYTYFDYHPETQYLFRDSQPGNFDWNGVLVDHLDRKIPLYYAGWSDNIHQMGHAFVLDAYSDSTHFHINWGWGGSFDGFFYIENLSPGSSLFNNMHEVIINAVPNSEAPFCSGQKILTAYEGIIEDGSGPLNFYNPDSECEWLIMPEDSANGIKFEFLKFELNDNDEIFIFNGPDDSSPVLKHYTGADNPEQFQSTADKILVRFISGQESQNEGWLLSYAGIKAKYCNLVSNLTASSGIITDGSNDYMYHNNTTCTWNIMPSNAQDIRITFLEFDTEPENDRVIILNANNQLVASFSGHDLPEPVLIEGHKATIMFDTNDFIRGGGFTCLYEINVGNPIKDIINNIEIFPNPCSDFTEITLESFTGEVHISVYDAIGKQIYYSFSNAHDNLKYRIDVSRFNSGLYIIELKDDKMIYRGKLLKK